MLGFIAIPNGVAGAAQVNRLADKEPREARDADRSGVKET
jgi:hypothetical protein